MKLHNYINRNVFSFMLIVYIRLSLIIRALALVILFLAFSLNILKAHDSYNAGPDAPAFVYDEIPVLVLVKGAGNFYIDVLYTDNNLLYVNLEALFKALKISCAVSQETDQLNGIIGDRNLPYNVDYNSGKIKVGEETIVAGMGLVKEMGTIYMESSLLDETFGIMLNFNFRSLSVLLKTDFELPVIKIERIERMRNNISKMKGEIIADTVLRRDYHLFRVGTADWALSSFQTWGENTDNLFSLGLGSELLYGEADIKVNYYDNQKFDTRQLNYLWKWVDNDKKLIKQAQVGRISDQTIAFINAPVAGVTVRNSPTTIRKTNGFFTINEVTEPSWTVELYINNVLVDYTKADASGVFVFKVPIVYGYNTLLLKFFGPMGEERTEERTVNMPYTIMPAGELEYGLSAGVLEDTVLSRFGKADLNYGINRFLTVGGGLEYLSSIPGKPFIPYGKISLQPFSRLIIKSEYALGVKARVLLDYYMKNDALLEVDYSKFSKGQLATKFNAPEELRVKFSIPVRVKEVSGYIKTDYTQLAYSTFTYNQARFMISGHYGLFSANSSTQINWVSKKALFATTDLSASYKMMKGFTIRPSARFNLSEGNFMTVKTEMEKRIPFGYIALAYERNVYYGDNFINLTFKYDLPFARTSITASRNKRSVYTSQSAQGSMAFGAGNGYVHKTNVTSVGKGGISIYPFLDVNHNGVFDKGEKMVKNLSVKINGGRIIYREADSIVRITGLEPFVSYNVELSENLFENISWRLKKRTYKVLVDPNQFKSIEIPVTPVGEFNGMVVLKEKETNSGIGRILVDIYDENDSLIVQTLSESDGYISYLGLEPGNYRALIDTVQLHKLNYNSTPSEINFTIDMIEDGDIVEDIVFSLMSGSAEEIPDTIQKTSDIVPAEISKQIYVSSITDSLNFKYSEAQSPEAVINTEPDHAENISNDTIALVDGSFFVQVGAFRSVSKAKKLLTDLERDIKFPSGIVVEDGYYKVRFGYFAEKSDAEVCKGQLTEKKYISFIGRSFYYGFSSGRTLKTGPYFVGVGSFRYKSNAIQFIRKMKEGNSYPSGVILEDGLFKVRFGYFETKAEAISCHEYLVKSGVKALIGESRSYIYSGTLEPGVAGSLVARKL